MATNGVFEAHCNSCPFHVVGFREFTTGKAAEHVEVNPIHEVSIRAKRIDLETPEDRANWALVDAPVDSPLAESLRTALWCATSVVLAGLPVHVTSEAHRLTTYHGIVSKFDVAVR